MNRFFIIALIFFSGLNTYAQPELTLMPWPREISFAQGQMRLNPDFDISVSGNCTERLCKYATRVLRRLDGRTGMFFRQKNITTKDNDPLAKLQIKITREGLLPFNEDESYQIEIAHNQILLTAETDVGAMRGLETFLQLLRVDSQGFYFPELTIHDFPRFPWRGLLIDVGRHFMPVDVIKRNLDGMAAVKLNVLHLHLSEDQGFRIECKTFPELQEKGSDGDYFTQAQIKDIIQYAHDRGIRVMPEFDMPAHATSWFVGHPELASSPGPYEIETRFGVSDGVMDPTKESTYAFLDKFIKEMAALFPDPYFHIGGDENNGKQWNANPAIQKFKADHNLADNHELQAYFNKKILAILQKYNKKMVGWDEIYQPGLPKDIVIQSWRGRDALYSAANNGYQSFLSNGYYIDLTEPASKHYQNDPLPPDNPLTDDKAQNILGGEATMWAELITKETIDSRIWPRTAAIAERLWSPSTVTNIRDMYRRLDKVSIDLEELGLTHIKNQDMMLRRLTDGQDITAIKTLVGLIEPLKGYKRHSQGVKLNTYAPLTRLPDAAVPDAKVARDFRFLVDDYIETNEEELRVEIFNKLMKWRDNPDELRETIKHAPMLKDAIYLSNDLQTICTIGVQAVSKTTLHSERWKTDAKTAIDASKKPHLECELMITSAIEKLVAAAK